MITGGYGERILDVLREAQCGFQKGLFRDQEALKEAIQLGLVEEISTGNGFKDFLMGGVIRLKEQQP